MKLTVCTILSVGGVRPNCGIKGFDGGNGYVGFNLNSWINVVTFFKEPKCEKIDAILQKMMKNNKKKITVEKKTQSIYDICQAEKIPQSQN